MLGLCFVTGCAKRPTSSAVSDVQQARTHMRSLSADHRVNESAQSIHNDPSDPTGHNQQEYEARCEDIFIPLAVVAGGYEVDPSQAHITLHYYSALSQQELIALYTCEMERLGWECEHQFTGHEAIVLFKRPHKICMVSCALVSRGRMAGQQHLIIRYKNA